MTKTYVVLDFETTGLDFKEEQVTEIGAIKLNDNFEQVGIFHTFVALQDGNDISLYTEITLEQLETGISEAIAMAILKEFIGDSIVVAQWAPFDLAYLANYKIHPRHFICTKSLTSQAEPQESSSLGATCERLGIPLENAHRALDDAKATAEVLKIRLEQVNSHRLVVGNTIVVTEGRPLNFVPRATEMIITKKGGEVVFDNREVR